jgi:hypothetical protein
VEICFSVIQRKRSHPNDFRDLLEVERRLLASQRRVDPPFAGVLGTRPAYPTNSAGAWRQGRVEGGWCHAYQVEGASGSQVIVFRA